MIRGLVTARPWCVAGLPLSSRGNRVPSRSSRIALTGSALRRACRMVIRLFGQSVEWVHDHSVRASFGRCCPLACRGRPVRRVVSFMGWLRGVLEWAVDPVWQIFSDAVVMAEFFAGGSVVMQAIDQTNPASSRAIAVTTTWFNLPLAIM